MSIDFKHILDTIEPKKISYEQNKHRFRKVGFDLFQLKDPNVESYWVLEQCNDGEYLVATYEDEKEIKVEGSWTALEDAKAQNITIAYKNIPIKRISSNEFNFGPNDVHIFKKAAVDKLNNDKEFVKKLLDTLPDDKKLSITQLFPELAR